MGKYILGIDLGTTSLKAAVYDHSGTKQADAVIEYSLLTPQANFVEVPCEVYMDTIKESMQKLRDNPPTELAGHKVVKVTDYKKPEETGLPAANVLIYTLDNGATVVVRPSGTEPKIKTYFTTLGKDLAEAQAQKDALAAAIEPILA